MYTNDAELNIELKPVEVVVTSKASVDVDAD